MSRPCPSPAVPRSARRHRIAHECEGVFSEQDLARRSGLFQACRDVYGISRHDFLIARTGHDLAGVHADPASEHRSRGLAPGPSLSAGEGRRASRLRRGPPEAHRPRGPRDPEDGHDGVADELLDGAAVALDRRRIASKYRSMTRRSDSGSSASPIAVEPTTSQNTTVTVLRTSEAGSAAERGRTALPAESVRLGIVVSAHLTPNHLRSLRRREDGREIWGQLACGCLPVTVSGVDRVPDQDAIRGRPLHRIELAPRLSGRRDRAEQVGVPHHTRR